MEISSILLILAVFVMVGAYLYLPFMARSRRIRAGESHEVSALKAERDRVIDALQELDFDFNLGKIPAGEYPEQRAALLQKGADILRRLDESTPAASSAVNAEARIEKATAAGRADSGSQTAVHETSDDDLEAMIAARRRSQKSRSAGFCPKCGKPVLVTDKFCPACGKSLS
ncbi:MAG: zinc ribbon domain-containing protein [Chloroflexi bacterium]|nr:zinc ribbon domain-containing protein [Chloroflexota bacterium]